MTIVRKDIQFKLDNLEGSRSFWIVASTEEVDRDGDMIFSNGWRFENFMKNPVIPWAHKYDQPPVAKALNVKVQDRKLVLLIQFAKKEEYPFADTIFRLYKEKYLNAFSVGFFPIRHEQVERQLNGRKTRGRNYYEQELWEVSACTIPSNPNALTLAKTKGILNQDDYDRITVYQVAEECCKKMLEERIKKAVEKAILHYVFDDKLRKHGIR